MFEFFQTRDKVSVPINVSLSQVEPDLKFKGKDLPPMSLTSLVRLFSSSTPSSFPSAIASTVMNA